MKKMLLLSSMIMSTIAIVFALVLSSTDVSLTYASPKEYGISMSSSKNKLFDGTGSTSHSGEATIKTDLGNNIDFTYSNLAGGSSSVWHLVKADGYFYNTTPIHGMSNISVQFTASSKSYKLYWSGDQNFDEERSTELSSNTSAVNFGFNDYYPTYFKFVNTSGSNLSIASLSIALTCQNNCPILSIYSENETMGSVSGGGIKTPGDNVTITATPNLGYRFVGWYDVHNTLVSEDNPYNFTIGNEDLEYIAKFTYESYTFIVESESNEKGTVSDSSGSYNYQENVTISASANDGYTFSGWYRGSNLVSTENPYSFTMPHAYTTYTAKFSTNSYQLTLINDNEELGSISGEGMYQYGSNATATATPNTGVSFLGWYNEQDELIAVSNPYVFTMPHEDVSLTAKFAWTPYSVEVSINDDEMGSVLGAGSYTYGQQVNLVATPEEHHSFFGWFVNDELYSSETWLTFDMPANNLVYEARFTQNYYLNVYSDDESMGTVTAPAEWGAGLEVTVTADANIGYAIDYWADENYDEVAYAPSYTFVMPEHNVELIAVFDIGYILTLSVNDESLGTVTGSGHYKAGREVTIIADAIYGFKGWYDLDDSLISNNNPYSFIMPSNDCSLIAKFMTAAEKEEEWNIAHGVIPMISYDEKTLSYGLYPQTNINDSSLIAALNALTEPKSNGWYLCEGDYYAKVSAKPYYSSYTFDNGATIVSGTTYWFKCELITWDILSSSNGEYYILSSALLDYHNYYHSTYDRTIGGKTVSPNNYQYSDIRAWLNSDFYNSAFALNKSYIQTSVVNNSASTTFSNSNQYACNNTQDKVFLPSYRDYRSNSYGFANSTNSTSTRYCKTTDWARAKGSWYSTSSSYNYYNGSYWTRSPTNANCGAWCVNSAGELVSGGVDTNSSVRPSLSLVIAQVTEQ